MGRTETLVMRQRYRLPQVVKLLVVLSVFYGVLVVTGLIGGAGEELRALAAGGFSHLLFYLHGEARVRIADGQIKVRTCVLGEDRQAYTLALDVVDAVVLVKGDGETASAMHLQLGPALMRLFWSTDHDLVATYASGLAASAGLRRETWDVDSMTSELVMRHIGG